MRKNSPGAGHSRNEKSARYRIAIKTGASGAEGVKTTEEHTVVKSVQKKVVEWHIAHVFQERKR